ncbi:MAG: hypothetical protein ACI31S_01805 [Bacilli bacterium]
MQDKTLVDLENNLILKSENIEYNGETLKKKLDEIIVDYADSQEIKTNEKINGKTVYAKRLTFTTNISNEVTIEHGIKDIDQIWIDYSNSFFRATTNYDTYTLPIILYGGGEDKVCCLVDDTNIMFLTDTGWGEQWIKNIVLKYTKTTD